jgi:hypothetical protein
MSLSAVVSKPGVAAFDEDFELDLDDEDFDELDFEELDFDEDFDELDFEELDLDEDFDELAVSFSGCGWNGNISSNAYSGTYSAGLVDEAPSSSAVAASAGGVSSFPSASMANAFASSASM